MSAATPQVLRDSRKERRDTEAISRKQHSLMPAPAQRILIQRLSPEYNITGSFIQSCHPYTATEIRKDINLLASHGKTEVSRRVLEVAGGQSGPNSFEQEMARQGQPATQELITKVCSV